MRTLFLTIFIFGSFLSLSLQAQCNQKLRIGFITGLSGEGQVWGDAVKNGFEMGLADAGCASVVRMYEDDQFVPAKSIAAFHKLVEQDHVNVIVVASSTTGNVLAPLAQQRRIPLFAWASDSNVARNRSFVVRTWNSGEEEGIFIAKVAKAQGYKRIAIFSSQADYPISVNLGLLSALPSTLVILNRDFVPNAKDYRTEITLARSKNVDAVYACLISPGTSGILARQMKQLHLDVPIFGCETLELDTNFKESGGALAGAWFVTGGVQPEFESRYRVRFGEPGTMGGAAVHYDLARMLSATTADGGEALITEILSRSFEAKGLLSISPSKEKEDQSIKAKLVIKHFDSEGKIQDGK